MRKVPSVVVLLVLVCVGAVRGAGQDAWEPVREVKIGPNREFRVNGKPFFPIMGWLQGTGNLPKLKAVGMNSIAGYWRPKNADASKPGADQYAQEARRAGLYFLPPYEPQFAAEMRSLKQNDAVLAWMHSDEPDKPVTRSLAELIPGKGLIVNNSRPLFTMLDGDAKSSAVLDPMAGASFAIKFQTPVTVTSLAVMHALDPSLAAAKEVAFTSQGKEILRATLEKSKELQKFRLDAPATFKELTFKVLSTYPAKMEWGTVAEIQGFDADGKNVLLSPSRKESSENAEEVMAKYRALKEFDPSRPMLMTVTDFFIHDKTFDHWWNRTQQDALYPGLLKAADVVGFDVYPIYGWNQPAKIAWVSQGMDDLRAYAGRDKPAYQWIETQPGGGFGKNAAPVTGVEIRSEVWQAIIRGATAIGYFTHRFQPNFSEFGVPEENQKAILEINRQLTRLTPVLCSPDAEVQPKIAISGGLAAQCLAKQTDGAIVIFAQNIDAAGKKGLGTLALAGLKAGTKIEVVDEGRTLRAEDGRFSDAFDRLGVHVYRVKAGE